MLFKLTSSTKKNIREREREREMMEFTKFTNQPLANTETNNENGRERERERGRKVHSEVSGKRMKHSSLSRILFASRAKASFLSVSLPLIGFAGNVLLFLSLSLSSSY